MDEVWEAMNQEFINSGENFRIMTDSESKDFQSQYKDFTQQLELLPLLNRYGQPRGVRNFKGEFINPEFDDYR